MGDTRRGGRVVTLLVALSVLLAGFGAGTLGGRLTRGMTPAGPQPAAASVPAYSAWDPDESPNYYRVLGAAVVGEEPAPGTVAYGALDGLGRATGAVALVTYDSMAAGLARPRGSMGDVEPSGWGHNEEVDIALPNGRTYHGYLFNRSHLVAKSLGGDDAAHNLITGTRMQNVGANVNGSEGGMAYAESLARGWLETHRDGTVYYAAVPVYEGDELLARSVVVDLRTSDGSIDQRIEVFNAALGFSIDYATGGFAATQAAPVASREEDRTQDAGEAASEGGEPEEGAATGGAPAAEDGERRVIVTGSGKAYHHDESCRGLANARSMKWVSVDEAEAMGRHPCGICGG